jgi:hypothetical protein
MCDLLIACARPIRLRFAPLRVTSVGQAATLIWNDLFQVLFFQFYFFFLTLDNVGCFDNESV